MNITLNRRQEVRLIEIGLGTLLGNLTPVEEPVVKKASKKKVKKNRRRKMNAAQKKAVSERMRKYWANRRKAKK
jgi:hypothetical protein